MEREITIDVRPVEGWESRWETPGSRGCLYVNGKLTASFRCEEPTEEIVFPRIYSAEGFLSFQDYLKSWSADLDPIQMKQLLAALLIRTQAQSGNAWINQAA